jgi:hypothetical protein
LNGPPQQFEQLRGHVNYCFHTGINQAVGVPRLKYRRVLDGRFGVFLHQLHGFRQEFPTIGGLPRSQLILPDFRGHA